MSNTIDFLMKHKKDDGTFDVLHPITKVDNVKVSENIEVMLNENLGSFKNGDVISADTPLDDVLRKLLQVQKAPTYTAPSASISLASGTKAGSYEIGSTISPSLTGAFTQNDAGALTQIVIKKNDTEVATSESSPVSYEDSFVIGATVTYKTTATYEEGPVKKDNFGDDYPTGHIAAGSVDSANHQYTCYRKYFYGADSVATAPTTSANVRDLPTGSTAAAANNTTFNLTIKKGQTRAVFAYPATLRDVSSVKYVEFNNDESKSFFTKTTVDVEGADGYTAASYKVYTYIPAQPFPSDMTFKVTI